MTYEKIVEKLQKSLAKAKADKIDGHLAVQINVTGEGEGALYIEIENGKVDVQPYEYYDNNAVVTVPSDVLVDVVEGKLDMEAAYNEQKLGIDGDVAAALAVKDLFAKKKAPAKKATAKKAPAKKAAEPKAEETKAEEVKAEKKAPAKKTTAKKTTAKKAATAEVKAEEVKAEKKAPAKKTAAKKTTK